MLCSWKSCSINHSYSPTTSKCIYIEQIYYCYNNSWQMVSSTDLGIASIQTFIFLKRKKQWFKQCLIVPMLYLVLSYRSTNSQTNHKVWLNSQMKINKHINIIHIYIKHINQQQCSYIRMTHKAALGESKIRCCLDRRFFKLK